MTNPITDWAKENKRELKLKLVQAGLDTRANMVKVLTSGSRSGTVYKRGNRTHQASAPGEPPKSDTGNLIRSIEVGRVVDGIDGMSLQVILGTNYAPELEERRPFAMKALDQAVDDMLKRL